VSFIITLDGPAGTGKSSVARRLAKCLGIRYLDTGAIYRAVAYSLDKKGIAPNENEEFVKTLASIHVRIETEGVFVEDDDVSALIRSPRVDHIVSGYAALDVVRRAFLDLQRSQAKYGDLVVEGRDTGSVVFPDADIKFFLTATLEARAERRYKELLKKGEAVTYQEVLNELKERDRADTERTVAPLREPEDAIHVDTSSMLEDEVVNELAFIVRRSMTGR
jgi:cytidylate kinase